MTLDDLFGLTCSGAVVTGGASGIGLDIATVLGTPVPPSCWPTATRPARSR
ncbi:hypothetical protein KQR54_24580 [Mycobacterium gordonae]|uniref:hypothetical protein n=1 Tax=Mycobacterium gordonae TaxID=1778 RepID=UPI00210AD391|nr:hypothetical protein [Mycobacterium gordonae]MCQ4364262.1 hypothetical protein [Mycobacterium gordonae]